MQVRLLQCKAGLLQAHRARAAAAAFCSLLWAPLSAKPCSMPGIKWLAGKPAVGPADTQGLQRRLHLRRRLLWRNLRRSHRRAGLPGLALQLAPAQARLESGLSPENAVWASSLEFCRNSCISSLGLLSSLQLFALRAAPGALGRLGMPCSSPLHKHACIIRLGWLARRLVRGGVLSHNQN